MFIVVPPQGCYSDFATVIAVATTAEEAITIAEENGDVVYLATGYEEGSKIPRTAIDVMRTEGRFIGPTVAENKGMGLFSKHI